MSIEVETGLGSAVEHQNRLVEECAVAARVNNVLLLAQAMGGVDVTKPLEAQKVLRHLAGVEQAVRNDSLE